MKIGHSSISENNTINGQKGDQTNKEVTLANWTNRGWNIMLRPKNPNKAEIMAQSCEKGCANNNVGYSQSTRNTLKQEAEKVNFDLSKVGLCNCDCSSFITVCVESAGIIIPYNYGNAPTTRTMKNIFMATGEFDIYTDSIYLTTTDYLKRGDILIKEGSHTVMVLENGSMIDNDSLLAIDISKNQGVIDFAKVKNNGISKIILRATTKSGAADSKWTEYLRNCDAYKILVECYKYSYALTVEQAIEEASGVLKLLDGRKMFIWLDLEENTQRVKLGKSGITNIANTFISVCNKVGYEVGIYCNLDWYKNCIDDSLKSKYKFWIARYPKNDMGVIVPTLKPNVGEVMWQYSSKGKINGINGNVDMDMICKPYNNIESKIDTNTCVTSGNVEVDILDLNNDVLNIVTASKLNVRKYPTTISPIISKLVKGEKINIQGYVNGWYAIDNALSEWVSANYIQTKVGITTATSLNYREGVGTNSKILGQYPKNTNIKILNKRVDSNGVTWYLCLANKNKFGWASSKYITLI